jgi:uncharacterized LabA/DUF88 family protein
MVKINNITPLPQKIRVSCFIDGFNLYHAIDNLGQNHLKWVNLRKLMECYIDPNIHDLTSVYYFSAYADWLEDQNRRHKAYTKALQLSGVTPIMGSFKRKSMKCFSCNHEWIGHEEKQTDVNIALWMIREAIHGSYDQLFLVSRDSDLAPALEFIREMKKERVIKIITPPQLRHSKELFKLSDKQAEIKKIHIERSLLPAQIQDAAGKLIVSRPAEYYPMVNVSTKVT